MAVSAQMMEAMLRRMLEAGGPEALQGTLTRTGGPPGSALGLDLTSGMPPGQAGMNLGGEEAALMEPKDWSGFNAGDIPPSLRQAGERRKKYAQGAKKKGAAR